MSIKEAKQYIQQHKKRQADPFLWPDFMTGLPDRAAVRKMLDKYYAKLSTYCVSYIAIDNIQPYIVKYGSRNHVEIIQWAASILKTTADRYDAFVGILDTHDFVTICKTKDFKEMMESAARTFKKKASTFYSKEDLENDYVLAFSREAKEIKMGLMELKYCATDGKTDIPKERIITELERSCTREP